MPSSLDWWIARRAFTDSLLVRLVLGTSHYAWFGRGQPNVCEGPYA